MNGLPLPGHGLRLPKLRVKKQWFEQLADAHAAPAAGGSRGLATHDDDDVALDDDLAAAETEQGADAGQFGADIGAHGALTPEAEASFALFASDDALQAEAEEFEARGHLIARLE